MIPLDETVALAKSICIDATEQDEALFKQWIWEGIKSLGVSEDDIKACTVGAKNFLAKKPEDCRRLIDVALYDAAGCQLNHVFHSGRKRIYPAQGNVIASGTGTLALWIDVSEDAYNIVIGSNGTDVSAVAIRYFSYPLDTNGFPLIREDESLPLAYFCKFMYSLRKNENQSEIQSNEFRWKLNCDIARAKKKLVSNEMLKTIASNWSSLIPNLNPNRF
jgi:hypothetical protein